MNVFADFHHASLLNSLILLFEKRMGGNLYRPIGTEWFEQGYWKIYDHPATVQQFLGIGAATPDGSPKLNEVVGPSAFLKDPIIYDCKDIESGQTNKAITYEGFMAMPFDLVIASIPAHIAPFRRLVDSHPSHPKLIFQVGNAWNITPEMAAMLDGVLSSAKLPFGLHLTGHNGLPLPAVQYHQEFDLAIFNPLSMAISEPLERTTVSSFVNCFSLDRLFQADWELFQRVESLLPDWTFRCLGGQCRDGAAHGSRELAQKILESRFIWHTKAGGDGYGHILHNVAACGRPLIIRKSDYFGKMGESLLIDGQTCLTIDGLSAPEIVDKIVHNSAPYRWVELCGKVEQNFKNVCNFNEEFELLLTPFLELMLS